MKRFARFFSQPTLPLFRAKLKMVKALTIILAVVALSASTARAAHQYGYHNADNPCRVLALSGGGDKGAYEAGVVR